MLKRAEDPRPESQIVLKSATPILRVEAPLGKILRMGKDPVDQLDLPSQKAELAVFDGGDSHIFSVYLPEMTLSKERLVRLLTQARPRHDGDIYGGQGVGGIIADWKIIDSPEIKENQRLMEGHAGALKQKWTDFVYGDRVPFMRGVSAPTQYELDNDFNYVKSYLRTKSQAEKELEKELAKLESTEFRFNHTVGYIDNKLTLDITQLPPEYRESLTKQTIEYSSSRGVVIDPDSDAGLIYKRQDLGRIFNDVLIYHVGNGLVEVKIGDSWKRFDVNGDEVVEVDSYYIPVEQQAMIPWLVWKRAKDQPKREYLDKLEPDSLGLEIDPRANKRLGFILATALSDTVRDKLPERLSLGGDVTQGMLEPQIPLLVYMLDKMLLLGEFFERVEQFSGLSPRRVLPSKDELKVNLKQQRKNFRKFRQRAAAWPLAIALTYSALSGIYINEMVKDSIAISESMAGDKLPPKPSKEAYKQATKILSSQRAGNNAESVAADPANKDDVSLIVEYLTYDDADSRIHSEHAKALGTEHGLFPPTRPTANLLLAVFATVGAVYNYGRSLKRHFNW
jgi:hypothetical protein